MTGLNDLARNIMECEFDNDSSLNSIQSIECWLESNLGLLNTLINTEYYLEGPELDCEASDIHKQLYLHHYYTKKTRNAMRGIMATSSSTTDVCAESSGEILSLSDGESRVTFANRNETAKVIRGMAQDAKMAIDDLVAKYNMYKAGPRQIGGIEA